MLSRTFRLRRNDGSLGPMATVVSFVTIHGISGFASHILSKRFRISHIETGAWIAQHVEEEQAINLAHLVSINPVILEQEINKIKDIVNTYEERRNHSQHSAEI